MYKLEERTYVPNTLYIHAICSAKVHGKPLSALWSAIENPHYTAGYSAESLLDNSAQKHK